MDPANSRAVSKFRAGSHGHLLAIFVVRPGHMAFDRLPDHAALDQLPNGGMIGGKAVPVARHAARAGGDLPGMEEAAFPRFEVG